MKPTIVLLHGAFAESASWDNDIDSLSGSEHRVIAAANPLRDVSGDGASVGDLVRSVEGPVLLVRPLLRRRSDAERAGAQRTLEIPARPMRRPSRSHRPRLT